MLRLKHFKQLSVGKHVRLLEGLELHGCDGALPRSTV